MSTSAHATLRRYIVDGCRCDPCRTHRVRHQKRYLHDVANGRPRTVPATVVQDHIQALRDAGMSWWGITRSAGYQSRNAIQVLMTPGRKRVTNAVAARVLAVTPDSDTRPTAPRPVAPTRDRLRALAVMGWDSRALADHLDTSHDQVDKLRAGARTWTMARTQDAVARVFDELWDTPGPGRRTATWAKAQGWPAPMDLDVDTDTDTTSTGGCAVCEDIAFLRSCGESDTTVATRVGFRSVHYIADHLRRHQPVSA